MKTNNCYVLYRKERLNPWAVMKSNVDIRIITATNEDLREAVKR
jgi:transcriptional regulator with PAS, ATPase and Fis domain